jgi:hypothetical protein
LKSFKKRLNVLLIALLLSNIAVGQPERASLDQLDQALQKKLIFTNQKQAELIALKTIAVDHNDLLGVYHHNRSLLQAYLKFNFDSALFYAGQNLKIARSLKRDDLSVESSLDIANLYFSLDKFLEASDILKHIDSKLLSRIQLEQYLLTEIEFYQHYLANNKNDLFNAKVNLYRDSLLQITDRRSITFHNNWALKNIRSGKLHYAEKYLQNALKLYLINTADHAMISYLLGMDYELQGKKVEAIHYYSLSAAEDVRLSIKDNAAIQSLALLLYGTSDIDHAYSCTQSAIEDALFCGAKFRTLQMSNFYAIINTAYLQKEARGKELLIRYLLLISILSFCLTLAVIYVYKQMKRESRIKTELKVTTDQLAELNKKISESNGRLNEVNVQLFEANKIKETYIANFFDLCSAYINKLESFRKLVNKKASEHPDNLLKMLRSTSIVENEVDELYKTFDKVFLSLYPNFISEFNALLLPTERIDHKPQGELSTELRIYALIRLGITDSAQIAGFLRYSRSTIYNYRTSARNKAAGSRDLFEENVMKISSIHSLS